MLTPFRFLQPIIRVRISPSSFLLASDKEKGNPFQGRKEGIAIYRIEERT
jgi:hypothetical protein